MGVSDIIIPILYGAVGLFILCWIAFVFYWAMKRLGMGNIFKRKTKISDEVYEEVLTHVAMKKTLNDLTQTTTKYPKHIQKQYLDAFFEIEKVKGGKEK